MKIKCPHCGFESTKEFDFVEGDLIGCSQCHGRIDVVKNDEGQLEYIKSERTDNE